MWNHYHSNILKIWFLIIICNIGFNLRKVVVIATDIDDMNSDYDKKFLRRHVKNINNDLPYRSSNKRKLTETVLNTNILFDSTSVTIVAKKSIATYVSNTLKFDIHKEDGTLLIGYNTNVNKNSNGYIQRVEYEQATAGTLNVGKNDTDHYVLKNKAIIDSMVIFYPESPGSDYKAIWLTESTLKIVFIVAKDGLSYGTTRIGNLAVIPNYMTYPSDGSNVSCHSTWSSQQDTYFTPSIYVNGNWGRHKPPALIAATAIDPGDPPLAGFTVRDELHLVFNKETNMPAASNKAEIDKLIEWSSHIKGVDYDCSSQNCFTPGSDYSGEWLSSLRLKITILDNKIVKEEGYIEEGNNGLIVTPEKQIQVGILKVKLKGTIKSIDLSSDPSKHSIIVDGDWGTPVTEVNFVQVFYLIALICSALAFTVFIGQCIYIYTCKPKSE